MKKKFLILVLSSLTSLVFGQQLSLSSQYMFNEVFFNPGAVGGKEYVSVHLSARQQWLGFEGAPAIQTLTAHSYLKNNIGIGGSIFNDVAGPSRRSGASVMGSYHLPLSSDKEHVLGMGLDMSFTQHTVDLSKLNTYLPDDAAMAKAYDNKFVPDASVGFYYTYLDKGFVGLSVRNLIQSRKDLFDVDKTIENAVVRNYYFYGGYDFELAENWSLRPTTMVRTIEAATVQFDVSAIATYKKMLWFGTSYRHKDAMVAMAGINIAGFNFGYSYDFTISDIRSYSGGSHEIFLELQLPKPGSSVAKFPFLKRNRMYTP